MYASAAPNPSAAPTASKLPLAAPASTSATPADAIASAPIRRADARSRPSAIAPTQTSTGYV